MMKHHRMKHHFLIWLGWISFGILIGSGLYQNISAHSKIHGAGAPAAFFFRQDFKSGIDQNFWKAPAVYRLGNTCLLPYRLAMPPEPGAIFSMEVKDSRTFCEGALYPYKGFAISTRERFRIPFRVTARLKPSSSSGAISSLYTYTDPLDGNEHYENDIEFPTRTSNRNWLWTNNYRPGADPTFGDSQKIKLAFDPAKSFNEYSIEIYKSMTLWRVNGELVRILDRDNGDGQEDNSSQKVLLNIWYSKFWTSFSEISEFEKGGSPFFVEWIEIASLASDFPSPEALGLKSEEYPK